MKEKQTILVVDDGEINRAMLRRMLSSEYEILEAENGAKALRLLESNHDIAAVVLDLLMPVMDGFALLVAARSNPQLAAIPMLVTTQANDLESELRALECGATDFVGKPYKPAVVKQRLANLLVLSEAAALRYAVEKDELTGLYNKKTFFQKAEEWFLHRADQETQFICFDIERFKVINDLCGMQAGDDLLRFIAKKTQEVTGQAGICGKLEADYFGICVPVARNSAQRIITRLNSAVEEYPIQVNVVLAFGIYLVQSEQTPVQAMYDRAAMAARSIKGSYATHFAVYDETMRHRLLQEQEIINDTKEALINRQFEVWLQAKYNMEHNSIIGAEALVRWRHPEKGLISPNEFIPLFERNGFIIQLDEYVWENTCRILRSWLDEGRTVIPVSVNISRMNFYRSNLCEVLLGFLKKYNLPQGLLELEIVESAYSENAGQLIEVVRQLQKHGFKVAMDDFGSGYSSLNLLKDVPVDELKIDLGFLRGTEALGRGGLILSSVVRMAAWLRVPIVAEGVETKAQVEFLRSIGCVRGQGYYYAKPLPQAEFEKLMDDAAVVCVCDIPTFKGMDIDTLMDLDSSCNIIFNSIDQPVGIFELRGSNLQAIRMNSAYYNMVGISEGERCNGAANAFDLLRPHDKMWLQQALKEIKPDQILEGNICQQLPDGGSIELMIRVRQLAWDNDRQIFLITGCEGGVGSDVRLQSLLDNIPAGLGVYDITDRKINVRYLSRGMAKLNEMPEEIYYRQYGSDLALILGTQQAETLRKSCIEAYEKNQLLDLRYSFMTQAGNERWAWMYGRVTKNDEGKMSCYAIVSDVTESQRMEKELQQAYRESRMDQERYSTALLLSGSDVWEYEFATGTAMMKTDLMRRYGIDETVIKNFQSRLEKNGILEPEFIQSHRAMYHSMAQGVKSAEWTGLTRLCSKEKRWVRIRMHNIFDEEGKPDRAIAVLEDITDQMDTLKKYELAEKQKVSLSVDVLASVVVNITRKQILRVESYFADGFFLHDVETSQDFIDMMVQNVHDETQKAKLRAFMDVDNIFLQWNDGIRSGEIEYQRGPEGEARWVRMSVRFEQDENTGDLMAYGLLRDIHDSKVHQLKLQKQAENDALTGVLNRGALTEKVNRVLAHPETRSGAFIILDLDNFKSENDNYGHQHGDEILTGLAQTLRQSFRKRDIVGRLGGDEFVAFLADIDDLETAQQKMELLYSKLWIETETERRRIQVSAGVSLAPQDGVDFETLYKKADLALYEAKRRGKNCWFIYS